MTKRSLRAIVVATCALVAATTGTVVVLVTSGVTPSSTQPPTLTTTVDPRVPTCTNVQQLSCFSGASASALSDLLRVLDAEGPDAALAALRSAVDTTPAWVAQCHDMAHVLGQAAGRAHSPVGLLGLDQRLCLEGFSHGILEGFSQVATDAEFVAMSAELCNAFTPGSWEGENCAHSVGHAVALRPHDSLAAVFLGCDALPEDLRQSCGSGAVMALASPTASFDPPAPLDPNEVDSLCVSIDERYQPSCFTTLWQFYPASLDAAVVLDRLDRVCQEAMSLDCFEGLGVAAYFKGLGADRGETPDTVYARSLVALDVCDIADRETSAASACAKGIGASAALWWSTLGWSFDSFRSPCTAISAQDIAAGCTAGEQGQASGADPSAPLFQSS